MQSKYRYQITDAHSTETMPGQVEKSLCLKSGEYTVKSKKTLTSIA